MGTFIDQTITPLKLVIEKILCRQKQNTLEQFMHISILADMKSTKKPDSNEKLQNQSVRDHITFGINLQTFP